MKVKFLAALVLVIGVIVAYVFVSYPLPRFARRIAAADHVFASMKHGAVSVTITGEDAKKVSDGCIYDVKITFFKGSEALGDILSCTRLFIVSGKKYRDETGLLGRLAVSLLIRHAMSGNESNESPDEDETRPCRSAGFSLQQAAKAPRQWLVRG
jgi:hypothetical protein